MGQYCGTTSKSRRTSSAPISVYDDVTISDSSDSENERSPPPVKSNKSQANRTLTPNMQKMNSSQANNMGDSSQRTLNRGLSGGMMAEVFQYWEPNFKDVAEAFQFVEEVNHVLMQKPPVSLNNNPLVAFDSNYLQLYRSDSNLNGKTQNSDNLKKLSGMLNDARERYYHQIEYFDLGQISTEANMFSNLELKPKVYRMNSDPIRRNNDNSQKIDLRTLTTNFNLNNSQNPLKQTSNNILQQPISNLTPNPNLGNTGGNGPTPRVSNRSDNTVNEELKKLPVKDFADSLSDVSTKRDPASKKPSNSNPNQPNNQKGLNSSLDSSLNRGSEDDILNTSVQSSHNSSVISVRDLHFQKVNEQRLLNLVRASPPRDPVNPRLQKAGEQSEKPSAAKKTGKTASTAASSEKGKDSRVQYKHFWKEAERPSPRKEKRDLNESRDSHSHEFENSHRSIAELSKELSAKKQGASSQNQPSKYRYFAKKYDLESSLLSRSGRPNDSFNNSLDHSFHLPKSLTKNNPGSHKAQLTKAANNVMQIQGFQKAVNQAKNTQDGSKSARLPSDRQTEEQQKLMQQLQLNQQRSGIASTAKQMMYVQKIVNESQKHKDRNSNQNRQAPKDELDLQAYQNNSGSKQLDPRLNNATQKLINSQTSPRNPSSNFTSQPPISEEEEDEQVPHYENPFLSPKPVDPRLTNGIKNLIQPQSDPRYSSNSQQQVDPRLSNGIKGLIQPQADPRKSNPAQQQLDPRLSGGMKNLIQPQVDQRKSNSSQSPVNQPGQNPGNQTQGGVVNPRLAQSVKQVMSIPNSQRTINSVPGKTQPDPFKQGFRPQQIIEEDEELEPTSDKKFPSKSNLDQNNQRSQPQDSRDSRGPLDLRRNFVTQASTSGEEDSDAQSPSPQGRSQSPKDGRLSGAIKNVMQAQYFQKSIAQKQAQTQAQRQSSKSPQGQILKGKQPPILEVESSNDGYSSADAEIDLTAYVKGGNTTQGKNSRPSATKAQESSSSADERYTNPKLKRAQTFQADTEEIAKQNPFLSRGKTIGTPQEIQRQPTSKFGMEDEGPSFGIKPAMQGSSSTNSLTRQPSNKKVGPNQKQGDSPTRNWQSQPRMQRVESFGKQDMPVPEIPVKEITIRKSNTPRESNKLATSESQKKITSSNSPDRQSLEKMLMPKKDDDDDKKKAKPNQAQQKKKLDLTFEQKLMPKSMLGIESDDDFNDEEYIHQIQGKVKKLSEKMSTVDFNTVKKGIANTNPQKLIKAIKKK